MKVICSEGGPLIGMRRDSMQQWSGASGKSFIGEDSPFATDYDALGEFTDGRTRPIRNLTSFPNSIAPALLFAIPVETAVIAASAEAVLIAQVEAAEENWSFSEISSSDFDHASFDPDQVFELALEACTFVIFDSAYRSEDVGNDLLEFELKNGVYRISSCTILNRFAADLNLFKLERL